MAVPTHEPVTAIVAAFNEAGRIGRVLEVLVSYPAFDRVIVVDDGSTDGTGDVAAAAGAEVIRVEPNQGKGHALDVGVGAARTDVVFFADADIRGLTHAIIADTVRPVVDGDVDMFICMRNRKIYYLHWILTIIPLLGGERALTRELWERVPERYKARFQIEAALNFYAIHYGKGLRYRVFPGLSQTVKEAKYGVWDGFKRRLRMFRDIAAAAVSLQRNELPEDARKTRRLAAGVLTGSLGLVLAILMMIAGTLGPGTFIRTLFAGELARDPGDVFVRLLVDAGNALGGGVLFAVGLILGIGNLIWVVAGLARLVRPARRIPG